jgi:NAD(P)-dependent dehydrogenase (short-subunit alcohol dehydrogenase family)
VSLSGKVAIVTGASRGIGASVARAFAAEGCAVALAARDEDALNQLAVELSREGVSAIAVPLDVTNDDAVAELVDRVMGGFGRLDYACNNAAGGGHAPTPLADVPLEAFDTAIATTLRGVFVAMQREIPAMVASGGGAIVNMSSTAGLQGIGGLAAYVAAKHAVEGITKVGALDYADRGIRVNAVAPGPILTDNLARAGEEAQQAAAAAIPMRRVGQPAEVADAVMWLCSEQAAFITGTTVVIDGGRLAGTPPFKVRPRPG